MAKKKPNQPKRISNRRARHDYELGDSLVVGLELTGGETKSLRMGHGQLRGAYVTVKDGELYLINATISGTSGIPISESDQTRARKLLAKRREIAVVWCVEDVQSVRPDLDDDQAWEVLQQARRHHDATIGINWDVLNCHADMLDAPI